MNYFIKNIKVNKLYHLQDFLIEIPEKNPHLLITGKNGSGKTVLLRAIADILDIVKEDASMNFASYHKFLEHWQNKKNNTPQETLQAKQQITYYQNQIDKLYGKVNLSLIDAAKLIDEYQKKEFIISFYGAGRLTKMNEPKNPTKPNLQIKGKADMSLTNQFLYFLSDLKVQEALARNEQQVSDADNIKAWFEEFEKLLKEIKL